MKALPAHKWVGKVPQGHAGYYEAHIAGGQTAVSGYQWPDQLAIQAVQVRQVIPRFESIAADSSVGLLALDGTLIGWRTSDGIWILIFPSRFMSE